MRVSRKSTRYSVARPLSPSSACQWLPGQRAGDFVATVRPVHFGRFRRPCDRSPYTSTASGRSPAGIAANCFGVLGWRRRNRPRMARFGPGAGWPRPHRSLRASAAPPPAASAADPRRGASSRDTAPRPARASARLPRTGAPPSPCDRSSVASPGPDPRQGGVCRSLRMRSPASGQARLVLTSLRCVAWCWLPRSVAPMLRRAAFWERA